MAEYEAVTGNCTQSEDAGRTALELSKGSTAAIFAAALCRDRGRTSAVADELSKHFPKFGPTNTAFLPCLRTLASGGTLPDAVREFRVSNGTRMGGLPVAYCRGEVYLAQRMGADAATEFQKILDRRSWAMDMLYTPAYVGLARATALAGDIPRSRKAYEDFFAMWKDADPDIPLLLAARKEYAKLPASN